MRTWWNHFPPAWFSGMTQIHFNYGWRSVRVAALAAFALLPALASSGSAAPDGGFALARAEVALPETPLQPLPPAEDASEIFADAPYGVDPIVTGPVSAEFRDRQRALGCKAATWPHISSGCYPD